MYIKGHVETVDTKDQSNATVLCIEYGIFFVNTVDTKIKASNAFNAMFVNTVNTGVCGSYTTPYAEYYEVWKLCIKWPPAPAKREGYLYFKSLPSWGFRCSPVSLRRQFFNFLGLVNYKGDCRQDAQPIPNS